MILQVGGLGTVIGWITAAAKTAENFDEAESVKSKFNFWH